MSFNIDRFIGNLSQNGTLKNNRYDISMNVPAMFIEGTTGLLRNFNTRQQGISNIIKFRAEKATLPGINMDLSQHKRYGVGPVSSFPTNVDFTKLSIEFLETTNQQLYKFFYEWITTIFDFTGAGGNIIPPVPRYNLEYPKYFTTDMVINVYRENSTVATNIRIIEAFPSSISDKSLAWSDNNTLNKVDVAFNFKEWRIDNYATVGTPRTPVPDIVPINLPTIR